MPIIFKKASFLGKITLYSGGDQLKSLVSVYDVARCKIFEKEKICNEIYKYNENILKKFDICKKVNKNLSVIIQMIMYQIKASHYLMKKLRV